MLCLSGGLLFDGTGARALPGDVLIDGDRIVAVGHFRAPPDAQRIDCTGLAVAPGFIDAHSHSDLQLIESRPEKIRQGVTAEVVGNCGFSPYPTGDHAGELREFANGIFCGGDDWGWNSGREYLADAARSSATAGVSLVGHGSLRVAVAGHRLGPLPASDVDRMAGMLDDALAAGAAGFSTGLMYAPGSSAPFEELERLCAVVARRGAVYATHMRSYFGGLLEAIEEQLTLARNTGCRLQISHLQAAGAANWHLKPRALERIEAARAEGIDVAFDCYPYIAGSTVLTQALPQQMLEGGMEAMVARLGHPLKRREIAAEVEATIAWRWSDVMISAVGSPRNADAVGHSLAELSRLRGRKPVDVMLDLLIQERGAVNMICYNQSEENLRAALTHPLALVGSDGFYVKGRPHPRLYGTFPKLLGTCCRDLGWLTLEDAIHKITGGPAERFHLKQRGRLAPGFFADITVFDPAAIGSAATYEQPDVAPSGIRRVFREGRTLVTIDA